MKWRIEIHCVWINVDTEDDYKIRLFNRPLVSSFPASFEDQQYIGDEGIIHVYSLDGRQETTLVGPYSVRELHLEHFGE